MGVGLGLAALLLVKLGEKTLRWINNGSSSLE